MSPNAQGATGSRAPRTGVPGSHPLEKELSWGGRSGKRRHAASAVAQAKPVKIHTRHRHGAQVMLPSCCLTNMVCVVEGAPYAVEKATVSDGREQLSYT